MIRGHYLNVIECFVAEGSLLISTCTKKKKKKICWKMRRLKGPRSGGGEALALGRGFMSCLDFLLPDKKNRN